MEFVKIVGIIALVVFLVAAIGHKCIKWFIPTGDVWNRVEEILEYVEVGSLTLGSVCGIIHLFA